jgi:3-hydroxyisobutyrate dehydrogenase-like beta-hydroxyacid dehydrogenase
MADVTVLGLGNMGGALAEAFRDAGHEVTGWSRSTATITAAEACARSDLIVACVSDYDATRDVLAAPGVADQLVGKTLVQLASGGPADARSLAGWARGAAVRYLDGAIASYPARIGDAPTIIFYSGDHDAYELHASTLVALGGRSSFVGDDPGLAAAADLAWLSFLYGTMLGLLQGAAFLQAEGADAAVVFDAVPSFGIEIAAEAQYARGLIRRRDYRGDQATLDVHLAAMEHIVAAAGESGVSDALPRLVRDVAVQAVAEGRGGEEIAALLEVLRGPQPAPR